MTPAERMVYIPMLPCGPLHSGSLPSCGQLPPCVCTPLYACQAPSSRKSNFDILGWDSEQHLTASCTAKADLVFLGAGKHGTAYLAAACAVCLFEGMMSLSQLMPLRAHCLTDSKLLKHSICLHVRLSLMVLMSHRQWPAG